MANTDKFSYKRDRIKEKTRITNIASKWMAKQRFKRCSKKIKFIHCYKGLEIVERHNQQRLERTRYIEEEGFRRVA